FLRPIANLILNQPLDRRHKRRSLNDLVKLDGSLWYVPELVLVVISLFYTFHTHVDIIYALRLAMVSTVLPMVEMTVIGLNIRRSSRVGA
ncbi:mechanosensitive ion channel family protein, partial [Pseudomonas aeruginosa]